MTSSDRDGPLTLAVLAGGQGRRMGQPKANLVIHGRPILQFLLDQWRWPGPTILVTSPGREHPPACEGFDREIVDPAPGLGPLRGILTALQACQTSTLVVATVDMPGIQTPHLNWLAGQLIDRLACHGILPSRLDAGRSQIEPFPSAFWVSASEPIAARFTAGERSVHRLSSQPGFEVVPSPLDWPGSVWMNLNVPGDLDRFVQE